MSDRCHARRGILFGRCKKEELHAGDHDNGKETWPRTGIDLEIYTRALSYIEERHAETERRQRLARQYEERERRGEH
jgi:hypothetical protein